MVCWSGRGTTGESIPPIGLRSSIQYLRINALLLMLVGHVSTSTAHAQPALPSSSIQVILAEEIAQAGLVRLSDLFFLIDDWSSTSIDGYAVEATATGLSAAREVGWIILVNGTPVDLRILDAQNLNTLPVSLTEIEYVEVYNTPAFVNGVFAPAGLLHLHTRTPDHGAALRLEMGAGNEVGDPGPYRYTAFATPNIDRIGPTFQGAVSVADSNWHARLQFKLDEHHATDERISERVSTFYRGTKAPRLILSSVALDLSATGRFGLHGIFAGYSLFQDLLFFEPAGLETPLDHRFMHIGLQGDTDPGKSTGHSYRLSYATSEVASRVNSGNIDFDWLQSSYRAHYETRQSRGQIRGALGISLDGINSVTGTDLDDGVLSIPRLYGRFGYRRSERLSAQIIGHFARVKGQMGSGLLATVQYTPTPIQTITVTGSAARQPFKSSNNFWYWVSRGYTFSIDREIAIDVAEDYHASTIYTADVSWAIRPSDRFGLTITGGYRRFLDRTWASHQFQYDSLSSGFFTTTEVINNISGNVAKIKANLRIRLHPSFEQRFYYAYLGYPVTDSEFSHKMQTQPRHRLSYTLRFVPNSRLSLFARLVYRSETLWISFQQAALDSGGRYQADLPGLWQLNLSAMKRFWHDYLSVSLSLRNLLNTAARTHPAGAITNMAFHVRVQLYVN